MVDAAEPIRVVLAEMPPLLRDIVYDTLRAAPDVVVVGEIGPGGALRPTLKQTAPDVVIVGTSEPGNFSLPRQILIDEPLARVLMLAIGGRSAVMYELQPHQTSLAVVSPETLIEAIRARAGRAAWENPV